MLIKNKEHLTIEGLRKIVAIKSVMNNGLSSQQAGATNEFDITLTTGSALAATSNILYNLVHKRNMILANGGVTCEF